MKAAIKMSRTLEALKEITLDRAEVELTDEFIESGQPFKDIGVDSLDSIEILVTLEDELDIELDNQRLDEIKNVKDLVEYLAEYD
tara:strand:- start:587 stop:841 length:255 start_codon:yes stop_codon:yes gene_type:complete